MSKKQSSLMNFFKSSPKTSTPERRTVVKTEMSETPLRVQSNTEENMPPVKNGKRRRLIMSSDEEDAENEAKRTHLSITQESQTPKTPKTPKHSNKKLMETPKTAERSEMAESFINSFRYDESMDTKLNSMKRIENNHGVEKIPLAADTYVHEKLSWLKPENILDANKKKKSDPDYDPTTLYVPPDFLKGQTPGHQQWWTIKSQNFDTVLLFKVGKFYETYHMDAVICVNHLGLTYMRGNHAHAGFPEAAYGKFADQLISRGYKVARVEQTEKPQQLEARNNEKKGGLKEKVVKREVCRITTSATKTYGVQDGETGGIDTLDSGNKYLFALKENPAGKAYGVCFVDTSIGQFYIGQFVDDDYRSMLRTILAKYNPLQVLLEKSHVSSQTAAIVNTMLTSVAKEYMTPKKQFLTAEAAVSQLAQEQYFGTDTWPNSLKEMLDEDSAIPKPSKQFELAWSSLGAILSYLKRCLIDVEMITLKNFIKLGATLESVSSNSKDYWKNRNLVLDGVTIFNLNLIPTSDAQASSLSLYSVINHCNTPFGRRLLKQWICSPSCDPDIIKKRQQAVEFFYAAGAVSTDIKNMTAILKELPDLERLIQKIHTTGLKYRATEHPDSRAVMFEADKYNSRKIKNLAMAVEGFTLSLKLFKMKTKLEELDDGNNFSEKGAFDFIKMLLSDSIGEELEEVLVNFKQNVDLKKALEVGKVEPNPGMDPQYDDAINDIEICIEHLEQYRKKQEKERKTNITYWGTGKNRYQMEISDTVNVPGSYQLKSRKKGFGRYQTTELVSLIEHLEKAEENREKQSAESGRRLFEDFANRKTLWSQIIERLSTLDVIFSFVQYAKSSSVEVCRPEFDYNAAKPFITIENGSHPSFVAQVGADTNFIANDISLGGNTASLMLLTGPNMGGKSTLMRQVAVLAVMAHMGCLVPAKTMKLSPIDRIFTRIGANDRIMCGQSTFFVEMNETQIIMRDATVHSMAIIDELGRGTSTFDGTAIASAVLEEFANTILCRTFFSTHYHSLCSTTAANNNICQAHMKCMVENENVEDPTEESVTFLYKLTEGACPKSYGFYAAKLAGIRDEVVRNAYKCSSRIAKTGGIDAETRKKLHDAAAIGTSIDDLRKMVEAL